MASFVVSHHFSNAGLLILTVVLLCTSLEYLRDYFEPTYIRRYDANQVEVAPRFQKELWNCHEAVLQGTARSNSAIEAWHRSFKAMFASSNTSLVSFVARLQVEEGKTQKLIGRYG